jgi:hypothetical protein
VDAIVPTVALPPAIPFTLQLTPAAKPAVPEIFAVKTCAPPVGTLAVAGETVTTMSSFRLTLAEALARASAWLTAVTVTLAGDGRVAGAVYNPDAEIVPALALPPETPFTSQVTLAFVLPVTMA